MDLLALDSPVGSPLAQLLQNLKLTFSGLSPWATTVARVMVLTLQSERDES
jgi:hypothetical protein